ncbi:NmrA family transcriptional regulator [Aspergillus californicus]
MSKLLVVFGATGAQGGALINHVLNDPDLAQQYHLRGISRNMSQPAALELASKGVELIQADLSDPSSLSAAVQGAYAVFSVTNFWDSRSATVEVSQGKAVADAAFAANVTVMIFSSLPAVMKMTKGEITDMHHFDSKAEVEEYIRSLRFPVSVFYFAGWYMQNVWHPMSPKLEYHPDGSVVFPLPWSGEVQIPWIDITDTGKYLAPALRDPQRFNGQRITAASGYYSCQEIVDTWGKVSGRTVRLPSSDAENRPSAIPAQNSYMIKHGYFGPDGPRAVALTHSQLLPQDRLTSWEEFLVRNGPWFQEG